MKVYMVVDSGYEHHSIIRVFRSRASAEKLMNRFHKHQARKPHVPEDTESPDWDKKWAKFEKWQDRAPCGQTYIENLSIEEWSVEP